ncbi:ATP-binding cassette domain-containing protein [Streptomyces sp. NPDC047928]|uniref:ATP-binding cassette domain-containing protein n=1 Tax=unclassified Streptomyces TaxID=2593676 RepID=UPI003713948F
MSHVPSDPVGHASEILALEDISKTYDTDSSSSAVYALRNISLAVRKGKFLAVMGGPKQGKTTLLKVVSGATRPTTGTVVRHGEATRRPGSEGDTVAWLGTPVDTADLTAALDRHARVLLADDASEADGAVLRQAVDRHGVAAVMATTAPAAAARADAVVILHGGAVVDLIADAGPREISACLERAAAHARP